MKHGWEVAPIGELCEVVNGGTPKTSVEAYWGGEHAWLTPAEMGKRTTPFVGRTSRTLTTLGLQDSSARMLPPSSVILSSRAPIGHLAINTVPMATNQGCKGLVPNDQLSHTFLYYYLSSIVEELNSLGTGATFKELSGGKLKEVRVPVPPLAEQHRIVRILDEAFAGIAATKENAETNLRNARAVFESHLHSVLAVPDTDWEPTTLGAEVDLLAGFAFKSAGYTGAADGVRLLGGDNIVQGSLRWEDVRRWPSPSTEEYSRYQLTSGDIVLAMDRPWVTAGLKRAMISESDLPCLLIQRTARLRCGNRVESRFLMYLVASNAFVAHILGNQTGSGVPHVSGQQIKSFSFARPPIGEQTRLLASLDAVMKNVQQLETIYCRKLAALDELKQSLLHHAFTGQV